MSAPPTRLSSTDRAARSVWAAHYATRDGFRHMPAEELVRFCGRRRGGLGRVLEVGCGNGANLWFLAEHSTQTVGADFCESALRAAQELCEAKAPGRTALVMASADRLPFPDGTFDTVVELMVSQHIPWDAHNALYRGYRRVLRPGGSAFLYHLVQGTTGSTARHFDYPEGIALFPEAGRLCLPDQSLLAESFERAGFGRVEQRTMERTYPDGARARYAVIEGTAR